MTGRELWAKFPRSLMDRRWKQAHLLVYVYLDFHAGRRGWWRTTQVIIAADLDFGLRAIEKAVSDLRAGGLITTRREGNADGEITYGLPARVPHETAVPLDADPHRDSGRFRAVDRSRKRASSSLDPQTSTTDPDPFEKVVRRSWPA